MAGDEGRGQDEIIQKELRELASAMSKLLADARNLMIKVAEYHQQVREKKSAKPRPQAARGRDKPKQHGATKGTSYYRRGGALVKVVLDKNGTVVHRSEVDREAAKELVASMILSGGYHKNISISKLIDLPPSGRVAVADWLLHLGMIRRMGGAYRLRKCDEDTYGEVIEAAFAALPEESQMQGREE